MLKVTLRDSRTGNEVAQVLSPVLPVGDEIVLKRRDPEGGDPIDELYYIEDFVGWVYTEDSDGVFALTAVDVVVKRSIFDGVAEWHHG